MAPSNRMAVEMRLATSGTIPVRRRAKFVVPNCLVPSKDLARFRHSLLLWYDQNRRDLPWRKTRDPYRIWLSEIMLQQTRVAAVLDHYRIFLERFPDVETLAAASEDSVLAVWSGLGYYRRARMLHQCAKEIVQNHGGRFPENAAALQALPGIGRYTAAAIASIAFAEAVAVVDGNVERVIRRLSGADLQTPQIWRHAQVFLSISRPGDFNQAVMELGAMVCVPREPRCLGCPVREWCASQGEVRRAQPASRQQKKQIWCVFDLRSDNGHGIGARNKNKSREVRLVQRSRKASLMPGMWELPQSSEPPNRMAVSAHWRSFRHSITVTNYTVHVVRGAVPNCAIKPKGKWVAIERIPQIPITGLTRKILKAGGII
jgi:A/G-specific adenine glycosylase